MAVENNLHKLRKALGLTIDELSDQEDVQSSTISTLENNGGVYSEKPRAMRMLIRLGVPYKINHRGSIVVDNLASLKKPNKGSIDVAYMGQYYDDQYLGNGLSQSSDGNVFYNELRDAISQSELDMDELSEKYEIPVDKLVDLSSGRRFSDYHPETVDMLDDLNINFAYNDDGTLYVRRHFQVKDDASLADMMSESLYLKRQRYIKKDSSVNTPPSTLEPDSIIKEADLTESESVPEEPILHYSSNTPSEPLSDYISDPLDDLSACLKEALASYDWNEDDSNVLKEAYKVIGMRRLEEELSAI